jgi:hypothetical protein
MLAQMISQNQKIMEMQLCEPMTKTRWNLPIWTIRERRWIQPIEENWRKKKISESIRNQMTSNNLLTLKISQSVPSPERQKNNDSAWNRMKMKNHRIRWNRSIAEDQEKSKRPKTVQNCLTLTE